MMNSIRNKKLAVIVIVAMVLSITMSPVFATTGNPDLQESTETSTTIDLHDSHRNTNSEAPEEFEDDENHTGGIDDKPVVWHFVLNLPNGVDESLLGDLEIEAEFDHAGTQYADGLPAGENSNGNYRTQHFYIGTESDDILLDAKVIVDGEVESVGGGPDGGGLPNLVLSHIAFNDVEPEEPEKGFLEIEKIIEFDRDIDFPDLPVDDERLLNEEIVENDETDDFEITVRNHETNEETVEIISEEEKTTIPLAPGTYTLRESETRGATPSYYGDLEEIESEQGVIVIIEDEQTTSVTITNTFFHSTPLWRNRAHKNHRTC